MEENVYDNQYNITIEAFKKKLGNSHKDRMYFKLLEYRYGIQPATEAEWHNRLTKLKSY